MVDDAGRVAVATALAYATMLLALRVSGKRTLSQLNAFDLIVTVALGSALTTAGLSSATSWEEGASAIVVLCAAQYAVARSAVHLPAMRRLVKSEPAVVVLDGKVFHERLVEERLTEGEVHQAVRSKGFGSVADVGAMVLETDGTLSVIPASSMGSEDAIPHARPGDRE